MKFVPDAVEAGELLARTVRSGDVVLVKGSRGVKLEQVVEHAARAFSSVEDREMLYHSLRISVSAESRTGPPLRVFNVIQYITFRTAYASLTALLISLLLGPWLIRRLQEFQIGQHIREEGPKSHQAKAGTPTMGGVLIVVSIIVPTLLWANLRNPFVWLAAAVDAGLWRRSDSPTTI